LEEAEVLLALVKSSEYRSSRRATWETVRRAFRLFISDPGEAGDFARRTVGALVDHDRRHQSELQETFWTYQASNCNMNLTAQATYTHRHTVGNRLARIAELTGLDPVRSYDRELISLGLRVHRVVQLARPR
jgi:DNA-binding PucR family transcriptional regulator